MAEKSTPKANAKKKPTRTLKEKRSAKKLKSEGHSSTIPPTGR